MPDRKRVPLVVALCIALALVGVGLWYVLSPNSSEDIAPGRLRELISLKSVGLGHLENSDPEDCLDAFQQISAELPRQPLGKRNLAVALLMIADEIDPNDETDAWRNAMTRAQASVQELAKVEPESAVPFVLAGRLQTMAGNEAEGVNLLQQAVKRASGAEAAAIQFEIFQATNDLGDPDLQRTANEAIAEAYRLLPENRAIALKFLIVQSIGEDPAILDTLTNVEEITRQFEDEVQSQLQESLREMLANARTAVEEDDWRTAKILCRKTSNALVNRVKSDRSRVDRHPLEFVILDFPKEFYQRHQLARKTLPDAVPVRFEVQETALAQLANVIDITVVDFDLDQQDELVALLPDKLVVYSQDDNGQWQKRWQHPLAAEYAGVLSADLDADTFTAGVDAPASAASAGGPLQPMADPDFVLFGDAGLLVLDNRANASGERTLHEIQQDPAIDEIVLDGGAILGDFDLDGDLDVMASCDGGPRCLANTDGLHFKPWPATAIANANDVRFTKAILVDWDRDMDIDLVVPAGKSNKSGYLENLRHGRMIWRPFDDKFGDLRDATSLAILDADANASWDLLGAGSGGITFAETSTPVGGRVLCQRTATVDESAAEQVMTVDFDNDASQDLLALSQTASTLRRSMWGGEFASDSVAGVTDGAELAIPADSDHDGDLDLWMLSKGTIELLANEGGNANDWVNVTLIAQQVKGEDPKASGRVNQYGIGSLLELKAGTGYQMMVVNGARTHFGIGKSRTPDVVRIIWTNGIPQNIIQPPARMSISELESPKGSCPFLYAWNGECYEFVTDCLWASPLGLQTANATIMKDRHWEWLRISSEQLQPMDGEYRLQITEELWEAAYVDQVELIAIDHPVTIDIYTNEKVGPGSIAAPQIHQVDQRRSPLSASDARGNDVMEWIEEEDGRYLKGFQRRIKQGYTDLHYVEMDLGPFEKANQITLFMTGWIFPTDTSINVQLSQNPQLAGPVFPYLMVPDEQGNWSTVREFIGFPGGKTKTIAIDVTDLFTGDDHRLRVCTSAEIYWDAIFFTVDPPQEPLVEQTLTLKGADLHYRGVSTRALDSGNGPEHFDYNRVVTDPAWPPMDGKFTRYGDVTSIIRDADDRLVVLGVGDEMTLRFAAPDKPLAAGWKRDFVLHNTGWDKDADLNTVLGQTVEPLPFRSMSAYPIPLSDKVPDSDEYHDYLRRYQTRTQSHGRFQHWVRRFQP